MCGIAGFFGQYTESLLTEMSDAISHRGPDGQGELFVPGVNGNLGLAHRRLSIIDLSKAGHQPMRLQCSKCVDSEGATSSAGGLWLCYNGELYNFPELRNELEQKGHHFQSKTDTEIILHLYATEGLKAFERLNGIFAFALYDGRTQGHQDGIRRGDLILVRDGLGVKPLYYTENKSGVAFSSELKSINQIPDLNRELNPDALRMYLSYLYSPAPDTAFKSVKKLEPGHLLVVRNSKIINEKTFYELPYQGEIRGISEGEWKKRLTTNLELAVERQLISDVPVGAFLSGGMDSTSVVALMRKARPETHFRYFTIGDGEKNTQNQLNDLSYTKRLAKEWNLDLSVVEVRPANFELLEKALYHLDEPQADPAMINTYLICKQAKAEGIKVLMSGAGGDDIFSGYPRHLAVHAEKFWKWIPELLKGQIARRARAWTLQSGGSAFVRKDSLRKLTKVLSTLDYSQDERLVSFFLNATDDSITPLLGERFGGNFNVLSPLLASLSKIPQEKGVLNRMLYLETKHFLGDHNLNYVDKMSMASGVEVRVPLIDRDVVDLVARIPANLKRHRFENKYIFKQAMRPLLPDYILNRKKQGFGLPIRTWLQRDLYPVVQDTLSPSAIKNRGLFNPKAVENLIRLDREAKIDATFTILSLLCIELWCKRFVDGCVSDKHSAKTAAIGRST